MRWSDVLNLRYLREFIILVAELVYDPINIYTK